MAAALALLKHLRDFGYMEVSIGMGVPQQLDGLQWKIRK
jgi:hypothetical protein